MINWKTILIWLIFSKLESIYTQKLLKNFLQGFFNISLLSTHLQEKVAAREFTYDLMVDRPQSEFLKAATVRLCGCAKMFRNWEKLGFLNPKMHISPHFHLFWVISLFFKGFFMPFYLRKISQQKFWARKIIRF